MVMVMPCETHWRCLRVRLPRRSRVLIYLWQWKDDEATST